MSAAPNDPTMKAGGGIDGQVLGLAPLADDEGTLAGEGFLGSPSWRNRFWMKVRVAPADACWEWLATLDRYGYGKFAVSHSSFITAHRAAFMLAGRVIPEDLHLDHLCRNRACCNPDHLEPVTNAENHHRGYWASRTHCRHGHPFSEENTGRRKKASGYVRFCRVCNRRSKAESKQRAKSKVVPAADACKYCGEIDGHTGQCVVVS